MTRRLLAPVLMLAALTAPPAQVDAQIRGSERSRISHVVDGTTITIDYARPHIRGRTPMFGGQIGWGHVWTPGANEATTFEFDKDISLNGLEVPTGRYSVWMIPSQDEWEVILDPNDQLYHTTPPEPSSSQIRLTMTPESTAHIEALTFDFPLIEASTAHLRFRWETVSMPFRIDVPATVVTTLTADEAAPYVGSYEVSPEGPMPPGVEIPVMTMNVSFAGEHLMAELVGGPPGMPTEVTFIGVSDQVFNPAWMMNGAIFETEVDMFFEFLIEDGQASGFDVRGLEDRLMMRGHRAR